MNARYITSRFDEKKVHGAPHPVSVVGVYDDLAARVDATRIFSRVARQCASTCEFCSNWWSFDVLSDPRLRTSVAYATRTADMIWCSTQAGQPLPASVKLWIEEWSAGQRESAQALVALLRCPRGYAVEHSPALSSLSQVARDNGMELFKRTVCCEENHLHDLSPEPVHHPPWFLPRSHDLRHPTQPRWWGINE